MRKIKSLVILFLISGFLLSSHTLNAQRPPRGDFPEQRRERVREEIETLKMWKMLEILDLSSDQSDKFLPAWREVQEAHKVFRVKRENLLEELELALGEEEQKVRKKRIVEVLDRLKLERSKLEEFQEQFRERAKEVLNLEQQAKLLLFEEKFERRMMEMIRKYREKRRFGE